MGVCGADGDGEVTVLMVAMTSFGGEDEVMFACNDDASALSASGDDDIVLLMALHRR